MSLVITTHGSPLIITTSLGRGIREGSGIVHVLPAILLVAVTTLDTVGGTVEGRVKWKRPYDHDGEWPDVSPDQTSCFELNTFVAKADV